MLFFINYIQIHTSISFVFLLHPALEPGYAIRDMIIAVGARNMVTNPLSWSSKSVFEPTDKNKGFKSRSSLE